MLALSDSAVAALERVVGTAPEPAEGVRILVEPQGCAGLRYLMGLETDPMDGDQVVACGCTKLFVDADSHRFLCDTRIDFVDTLDECGFVFDNPHFGGPCNTCGPLTSSCR